MPQKPNKQNKNVPLIKSLVRKEFCKWNSCWVFIFFCFFFIKGSLSLLPETYTFSCSFNSYSYALLSQQPQIAITWNSFVIFMLMMDGYALSLKVSDVHVHMCRCVYVGKNNIVFYGVFFKFNQHCCVCTMNV